MPMVLAHNCRDFVKSKPPVVIFFLSLFIITITVFALTYYVKTTEKIINSDSRQNWVCLTKYLNKIDLCTANSVLAVDPEVNFTTTLNLKLSQLIPLNVTTRFEVYYTVDGCQPFCGAHQNWGLLRIDFVVPSNSNRTTVCATMTGPRGYLPETTEQWCDAHPDEVFAPTIKLHSGRESCLSDTIKLHFSENSDVLVYLSETDRLAIYATLLWIDFVLLFFIVIMAIYAVIYQHDLPLRTYLT